MKLWNWFRARSTQERMMIVVILLLAVMIATRWGYISMTAGNAIKERFAHPTEQADSLSRD